MVPYDVELALNQLHDALEDNDLDRAKRLLEDLRSPDRSRLVGRLMEEQQQVLLPQLDPPESADILEDLDNQRAAELIRTLSPDHAARIVDEMEPDKAADLLGDVPPEMARSILRRLEDPEEIHPLLLHPDTSAGGLMTSEYLALRRRMTAAEAIQAIREWKPQAEEIYSLFVIDRYGSLVGVVNLRQLIVADPDQPLEAIMDRDVISVRAGTDQEEVARIIAHYDLLALPVVDQANLLVGVITIDDVMDVLEDEATEDMQRMGGAQPLEQPYLSTRVFTIARKRVGWLMLLFITESLTGTVLRHFEQQLQAAVALAFFVPLMIGTGGNAGSQTTSTLIRALAIGEVELRDSLKTWWHEVRVGVLMGGAMGLFAYVRALSWGTSQPMAIAVALAILAVVVWANWLGALLPMAATKLKIDPTVVSGPVMSTLVDATGLYIYLSIARAML